MGKFGGCEIDYHSDLDMVFLYEADGGTFHARRCAAAVRLPPISTSSASLGSA